MATKTQNQISHKNTTTKKTKFFPVAILKHGVLQIDGHMIYTDGKDKWLYVSEDGQTVYMYNDLAQLVRELYKKSDDDDFIVVGWDYDAHRFSGAYNELYNYYNARFD
jgi:hypothetical protein